jgi:hypothetical protein
MNNQIIAYCIYIPATIALAIWIAKSLHQNTKAFLLERFQNNDALASATNNLIQTGFYLIALGYSFRNMTITLDFENGRTMLSSQECIEILATKLGGFTLMLGLLLFINFFIMLLIQKPKKQVQQVPFIIQENQQ